MKAVVLVAGEGTRLRPLTRSRPKPMLPVANRPLLEHVVESVHEAGIDEFVFVVGYERERIQNHFGDGDQWDIDIEYAVQEKQLGTGHALLQAEPYVDGAFVALNGDRIVDPSAVTRVVETRRTVENSVMAVTRVDDPADYGVVAFEGERAVSITEKPPAHGVTTNVINAGIYGLDRSMFDDLRGAEADGELGITTPLRAHAARGDLETVRFDGLWLDVSHLWDLISVNGTVLDRFEGERAPSASVHRDATVVGPVALGADVRVRPNATVLPGTALGNNVDIGANAVVSNAVVMPDARIGDGAVLRDCIVGENAAVGPNTTIEGGEADVVVDGVVHEDVRLGGVVGDNSDIGGAVTVEPGSVLGNGTRVESGSTVDGTIEDDATVRRG